jgi:hypothetical protein
MARIRLDQIRAVLDNGVLSGTLTVNLRGMNPAYLLSTRLRGASWSSGTVDVEAVVESHGIGTEVLSNLRSQGIFTALAPEMDLMPALDSVSGQYRLDWAGSEPRLRFTDLQLSTGNEVYTGQGGTVHDGQLLIRLSSGSKQLQLSGTLPHIRTNGRLPVP